MLKQHTKHIFCALAFLVILSSCAKKGEDCQLRIKILDDATSEPLGGVTVKVDGRALGTTDDDGLITETVKLSYDRHTIGCKIEGYRKAEIQWSLDIMETTEDDSGGEPDLMDELGELEAAFDFTLRLKKENF